jgi:hypothetical protein
MGSSRTGSIGSAIISKSSYISGKGLSRLSCGQVFLQSRKGFSNDLGIESVVYQLDHKILTTYLNKRKLYKEKLDLSLVSLPS